MARYIDADELKSKVNSMSTHWLNEWDTLGVLAVIDSVQTADVEEIIRCKDCRWGREVCGNVECSVDCNLPPEYHGYQWFCPNGERRTE